MWELFELTSDDRPQFPPHNVTRDVDNETGQVIDPHGGLVHPRPINYVDCRRDESMLLSMIDPPTYGDRIADRRRAMAHAESTLNNLNLEYTRVQRRCGTPPVAYFTTFDPQRSSSLAPVAGTEAQSPDGSIPSGGNMSTSTRGHACATTQSHTIPYGLNHRRL